MEWLKFASWAKGIVSFFRGRKREKLELIRMALEINREMTDQKLSGQDVSELLGALTTDPASLLREGENRLPSELASSLLNLIGTLFEVLAIHAGNEALSGAPLHEAFPKLFPLPRLELAQATFHKALWGLRDLGWSSARFAHLQEKYESAIPFPEKYRRSDYWRERGLYPDTNDET